MTLTYGQFLILFLVMPIGLLLGYLRKRLTSLHLISILSLATIAFIYTPIWDNYLVANEIWWYDPDLVLGITIAWVPIEEYLFFILQPIMAGLWIVALNPYLPAQKPIPNASNLPKQSVLFLGVIWLIFSAVLLFGDAQFTYLSLILVWAIPPIMLQLGFGADILWHRRRLVLTTIGSATLFLALADTLAIHIGIWTISTGTSLPILLGGILPIEEFIFFLITNILVTGGVTLLLESQSYQRLAQFRTSLRGTVRG